LIGAPIGFLSGSIGVGGASSSRPSSSPVAGPHFAMCRVFILVNSIAGLLGRSTTAFTFEPFLPWWLLAVVAGGLFGSYLGVSRFGARAILAALLLVLVTAGLKMLCAK
jgi:uncharacterized membrane protein YfcA